MLGRDGRLVGGLTGAFVGRLVGGLTGAFVGRLVGGLTGALVGRLTGFLVGRLVGGIVGSTGAVVGIDVGRESHRMPKYAKKSAGHW